MQLKVKKMNFFPRILMDQTKLTYFPWTSLMPLSENGHIAETEGNKMHHEEGIVIVGGGFGGLCFAAARHKYIITP
jgi:hypothetical protein